MRAPLPGILCSTRTIVATTPNSSSRPTRVGNPAHFEVYSRAGRSFGRVVVRALHFHGNFSSGAPVMKLAGEGQGAKHRWRIPAVALAARDGPFRSIPALRPRRRQRAKRLARTPWRRAPIARRTALCGLPRAAAMSVPKPGTRPTRRRTPGILQQKIHIVDRYTLLCGDDNRRGIGVATPPRGRTKSPSQRFEIPKTVDKNCHPPRANANPWASARRSPSANSRRSSLNFAFGSVPAVGTPAQPGAKREIPAAGPYCRTAADVPDGNMRSKQDSSRRARS